MQNSLRFLSCLLCLLSVSQASALPIGFGRNQGPLVYDQLMNPHFSIYHDERAPQEARVILESLSAARPEVERWLGIERKTPLDVILSSTTANASFANFLVDAIELQTLGRGGRDLAWHEYTHSTMYRHLDNIFGPAGSILHLPWMPAWWIEGLAETLSISGGSDYQYGIERYYALNGSWPSYDKLHSLYDGNRFSGIGYAISGAFVSYILRTYGTEHLPHMLKNFYDYSMPWWWPWSFVPWNGFMPMDTALKEYTGKTGQQLYEDYKRQAESYWKSQSKLVRLEDKNALLFGSTYFVQSRGDDLLLLQRDGSSLKESKIQWNDGKEATTEFLQELPSEMLGPRILDDDFQIYLTSNADVVYEPTYTFWLKGPTGSRPLFKRSRTIIDLSVTADKVIWFEEFLENQFLCWIPRSVIEKGESVGNQNIQCPLQARFPRSLQLLGRRAVPGSSKVRELWFRESTETLAGDQHKILVWDADRNSIRQVPLMLGGKPHSLAFQADKIWLALADAQGHSLRRISLEGQCLGQHRLASLIERLHNAEGPLLPISVWESQGVRLLRTNPLTLTEQPCQALSQPTSPLQLAMQKPGQTLHEHIKTLDPWQEPKSEFISNRQSSLASALPLGQKPTLDGQAVTSEPAVWKAKPKFAFPWIGIDAKGYQVGTMALPLMDSLQNERIQLAALYGVESRFPNLEMTLISTRFPATLSFEVFRRQAWNGAFRNETYYFEEKGISAAIDYSSAELQTSFHAEYKNAYEEPYIGDPEVWQFLAKGYLRELSLGVNHYHRIADATMSYGLLSNLATKQFNSNYDYEQLGLNTSLSVPLSLWGHPTRQTYGLTYSRVRGERRKLLKEAYRPLRTFVPGSGGGINEINQTLWGPGALTAAAYGDTQARAQFSWTTPLIEDLAKLIHIVYLQRLDFTIFYNYGNAWFHNDKVPKISEAIRAHGYNLDLQADIKGVKLNLGLGAGQVVGNDFELYMLFGFDALIDQG